MTIPFSTEMKIESKNCIVSIFIFSEIKTKKFNTNILLFFFFSFKWPENKMRNSLLIVLIFKFGNRLMINDYRKMNTVTVISYQAFTAKFSYIIDLTLYGLLIIQKQPLEVFCKICSSRFCKFHRKSPV